MHETQLIKKEIEIDGFNSIYYFEFSKDFSHEPEKHNFWEMVYVDSGNINIITDGVEHSLSQGQVIFHQPMEAHAHISDNKVANNMLVVSFSSQSPAMNYFKGKTFTLDKTSKALLKLFLQEAENALGTVPNNYNNHSPLDFSNAKFGSVQLLQCHFTELLIRLLRGCINLNSNPIASRQARTDSVNSLFEAVCEHMKKNIYSTLSLKDICTLFSVGKTQLCKIFNEWCGQSPMEYYMNLKIDASKKLLREKNYSISEISDMLGYSSIHNFSRAFKKNVGMSPSAYTKSIY